MPGSPRGGKVFRNSRFSGQRPKRQGQYISPDKFVNKASLARVEEVFVPNHSFNEFGLLPELVQTLAERKFVEPTPIQDGAIKPALAGRDVVGLANTGTGKTAAFVLPMIQRLKASPQSRALIIAPTRELATQIDDEFRAFARGMKLFSALCVGGVGMHRQFSALSRHPQVVIGTPGRLKDLNQQGGLKLDRTDILVLDEFDRMLDMGFIRDIQFLLAKLPQARQSLCFSATMPPEIKNLLHTIVKDPVIISVRKSETSDHIEQDVIKAVSKDHKITLLKELLAKEDFEKVLVFGQTKWGVQKLADALVKHGVKAEAIHGNKSQPQRQRALNAFKSGQVNVLVATDVAARGLDIPKVSHVINFDQPTTYEDYIHRIGRTARAGRGGKALTFIS